MPELPPPRPIAPLIVTLGLDEATFARLDALRIRFFPPERNLIPAHLSLFHSLPPDQLDGIASTLADEAACGPAMSLRFSRVMPLGSGFALVVEAAGLAALHGRLARRFDRWLTPQDRQPFRPHVTLMNKADRTTARLGLSSFRDEFEPWAGVADSLLLWSYLGGPWEARARYPFSGPERPSPED